MNKALAVARENLERLDKDLAEALQRRDDITASELVAVISSWFTKADKENLGEKLDAQKKADYAEFNETSPVSKLAGFRFDSTNVEAEISTIEGVRSEYRDLLERGFYDPAEYLPEYQDALKAAGIDTVIAEAQAQVDAFFAAK